jgi:hypothetical protein
MGGFSNILVAVAVSVVGLVLISGFLNVFRGGGAQRSQLLMRWRVALQFVALIIVMMVIYVRGRW